MKTIIKKTGVLVLIAFVILSCNDDFLERYPLDRLSNETFWKTENDLKVYNNTLYDLTKEDRETAVLMGHDAAIRSIDGSYTYLDGFSDNMAPPPAQSRASRFNEVKAGIHIPRPSGTELFGYRAWNLLRAINVASDNMATSPVPDNIKNKYIGEVRMFRAWFYYDKVSKFGDNQWVDHEVKTNEDDILFGTRDPREFVMDKVLEDINFAVANLPVSWADGRNPGRLDRWDALALKSRICLFEGTWRKYHGGTNAAAWLQEAAMASKTLIDTSPYSLYKTGNPLMDYNATHRVLKDLTGNPEVIHWVRYETGIRNNNIMKYYLYYSGGMTKDAIDDYLCTDGLPISLSPLDIENTKIEDVFVNRDPRLRQTVLHPADQSFYQYNQGSGLVYPRLTGMANPGGDPSTTGYHIIKMYNRAGHLDQNQAETPGIVFRLGEVYLNYAEAMAELGTITQVDLDLTINKLRSRVGMLALGLNPPMDPKYAADGLSSLIIEIRRERRIELFSEGFRYDDLRRWKWGKKLEKKSYGMLWDAAAIARFPGARVQTEMIDGKPYIDVYKGTPYASPVFDENKHYLWPMPLGALGENPNLGQNPGWE
ncbi:RagB/SusD family nutrient uptake outer membrane protein [Mariniflexile sp.]|uniref:RagB/SusD family nutrient uptake outer membrane protein n=1 Tax=Mariniflexile sp. TaxID=1979402 RepID=UPI004047C37F